MCVLVFVIVYTEHVFYGKRFAVACLYFGKGALDLSLYSDTVELSLTDVVVAIAIAAAAAIAV